MQRAYKEDSGKVEDHVLVDEQPPSDFENFSKVESIPQKTKENLFVNYLNQRERSQESSSNFCLDFYLFSQKKASQENSKGLEGILATYFSKLNASKNEEAFDNLLLFLLEHSERVSQFFANISKTQSLLFLGFPELLAMNSSVLDSSLHFSSGSPLSVNVSRLVTSDLQLREQPSQETDRVWQQQSVLPRT